jgi:hypothetical protein
MVELQVFRPRVWLLSSRFHHPSQPHPTRDGTVSSTRSCCIPRRSDQYRQSTESRSGLLAILICRLCRHRHQSLLARRRSACDGFPPMPRCGAGQHAQQRGPRKSRPRRGRSTILTNNRPCTCFTHRAFDPPSFLHELTGCSPCMYVSISVDSTILFNPTGK